MSWDKFEHYLHINGYIDVVKILEAIHPKIVILYNDECRTAEWKV